MPILGMNARRYTIIRGRRSDFIIDVTAEKRLKDVVFIQDYKGLRLLA